MRRNVEFNNAAAMKAVQAPIRCINAGAFPTNVAVNRKYAPGFDAVILEGVGHFPMLEDPEAFNQELADMLEDIVVPATTNEQP